MKMKEQITYTSKAYFDSVKFNDIIALLSKLNLQTFRFLFPFIIESKRKPQEVPLIFYKISEEMHIWYKSIVANRLWNFLQL